MTIYPVFLANRLDDHILLVLLAVLLETVQGISSQTMSSKKQGNIMMMGSCKEDMNELIRRERGKGEGN